MLGFPPKPTSILPYRDTFNPFEWIVQPKYRGWRGIVHNNKVYTRKGNLLPITTHYSTEFEYQLDGEIINPVRPTEHGVRTAIKNGTWVIEPIDIYIPSEPNMKLLDRLKLMEERLGIFSARFGLAYEYDEIFLVRDMCQSAGWEGAVIKRKDSIYKISKHTSIVDHEWFKVK